MTPFNQSEFVQLLVSPFVLGIWGYVAYHLSFFLDESPVAHMANP